MADYPSFGQLIGSGQEVVDDIAVDRAADGTGYARAFYASSKRRFPQIRHLLNPTQRDTLIAFYEANRTTPFNFTFEGDDVTYTTTVFEVPPRLVYLGNGRIQAEVTLAIL